MTTGRLPSVEGGIQPTIVDAKGDIVAASAADTPARLAVGTDNQRLVAASGEATGLKYVSDTQNTVIDAAGDLVYGTAADTLGRLAIGTAGQVLKVNAGATAPEWGAAGGGATFVGCSVYKSASQSVSSGSYVAITYNSESFDTDAFHSTSTNTSRITIPSGKAGKYLIQAVVTWQVNNTGDRRIGFYKNGSALIYPWGVNTLTGDDSRANATTIADLLVGDYIEVFEFQNSTTSINVLGGTDQSQFSITYLGA